MLWSWLSNAIFLGVAFLRVSTCLEILDQSENVQMWQGDMGSIHCQTDSPLDFCNWKKDDSECRISAGETKNCGVFTANLDGDKCSLSFEQGVNRNDVGTYTCVLIKAKEIIEGNDQLFIMLFKKDSLATLW